MHRLLERQLKKCFGRTDAFAPEIARFLSLVDQAYAQSDTDREMIERSTDLSSRELLERNRDLAVAESKYRSIFENVTDGLYQTTTDGRFISANPAMAHLVGYDTPEQMIAEVTDIPNQLYVDPSQRTEIFNRLQLHGSVNNFEVRLRRRDGTLAWASASCRAVRDAGGNFLFCQGSNRDITAQKNAEADRAALQQRLVDTARQAGMAEVAIGVLHNVGNVLNSVNVAASIVTDKIRASRVSSLAKASALIREHESNLAEFFLHNPKGRQLPAYLHALSEALTTEQQDILKELVALNDSVDHIKQIITTQQSYVSSASLNEPLDVACVIEDAIRINTLALDRHGIVLERRFQPVPTVVLERHKLLQILVNLISNAKWACSAGSSGKKIVRITLGLAEKGDLFVEVTDSGIGIAAEDLPRIFEHGFTRRKGGHGFGLHTSALAAKSLGGSLHLSSPGPNQGATFRLEVPAVLPQAAGPSSSAAVAA